MSSINLIPHTPQIEFTESELTDIIAITEEYSSIYKEIVKAQEEIQLASDKVLRLTNLMEDMMKKENDLMTDIASVRDLDPKTVSNEAANIILNYNNSKTI
jgi:hypothetical protein